MSYPNRFKERNADMLRLFEEGVRPTDIAKKYSLTRSRVDQVIENERLRREAKKDWGELSVRTMHGIINNNFDNPMDFAAETTCRRFLCSKNIGKKSLIEFKEWCAARGVTMLCGCPGDCSQQPHDGRGWVPRPMTITTPPTYEMHRAHQDKWLDSLTLEELKKWVRENSCLCDMAGICNGCKRADAEAECRSRRGR